MIPISPENQPDTTKYLIKQAEEHNALRMPEYAHDEIIEEMQLRDSLEHDPTKARILQEDQVGAIESSESNSDDE